VRKVVSPLVIFGGLQMHFGKLLREPPQADFLIRLGRLQTELSALVNGDADTALLLLIDATNSELRQYSVTHAMLVAVVCELAARNLPEWPAEWHPPLRSGALTMNLAMTSLQDTLALQATPPDVHQRVQIDAHAERSAQALQTAGVDDALWLEAVRHHHDSPPGPLADLPPARQLARLIQRADIFAARLSPRSKRAALSGAAAAKAAYLDERQQPDAAGTAIIKAVGIYPPGSYVRLASGEVAVVLRRGARANEPIVASVISRAGTPIGEPALRNTRLPPYAVTAGVAPHEVRLRLNLERLLRLL
jgi:HD-GYP domain-containing protein (c-di-GMP phosphodiesterase class II)